MLDIAMIRKNPDLIRAALVARNGDPALVDEVLALDSRWRELLAEAEALRAERNRVSKEIGRMKDAAGRETRIVEMRAVGDRIVEMEAQVRQTEEQRDLLLLSIPNVPQPSVPVGPDESHDVVVEEEGEPRRFDFEPLAHWDLGPELGILDFERGVKIAGSRFYVLLGAGARLQRALIAWMLDVHTREHGYTEVYLPSMVKEQCMWGAGQLPKLRDNIYHDAEDDVWFVGTAEIPLTNLHRDEILPAESLPLRYVAHTPCYRREKMSAGRDVRGIKRGHQFEKVEMYQFVAPETSAAALDEMVGHARTIARRLGIPHRLKALCSSELSFASAKSYDIEMWAPGCGEWLEVSSVSVCEDFQARRANVRYRPAGGGKPAFVHTLNGSGLALPRVMIAVLENYQQADGSVVVPEVLRPWMGGVTVIRR